MKKNLLMLVLGFFSLVSKAMPSDWRIFDVDGVRYMTTFFKDASVIYGGAYSGIINIPDSITVDGYTMPVSSIAGFAFSGCEGLVKVTIPKTVKSIALNAFKGCIALESIVVDGENKVYDSRDNCNAIIETKSKTLIVGCKNSAIPDGIKVISGGSSSFDYGDQWGGHAESDTYGAFLGCIGLQTISIPNSVTSIGNYAFSGCSNMKSITISNSIESISSYMFENCSSLSDISIPESVKSIGTAAFKGCSNLVNFYCNSTSAPTTIDPVFDENIQNTILHVKDYAVESFKGIEPWCNFKDIVVDEKLTNFNLVYYVDGVVYKTVQYKYDDKITPEPAPMKEGYTFSGWSEIPERMPGKDMTVTGAFSINKYKLNYFVDGVLYRSYEVKFDEAIKPEDEPTKEDFAFSGWSEIPQTMPARDVDITGNFTRVAVTLDNVTYTFDGSNAIVTKDKGKNGEVIISPTVESDGKTYSIVEIAPNVFKDNANITAVTIPDGVTSIGEYAFSGCKNIKTINIGSGIKSIGIRAFANYDKLADVTIYAENVPETDRTAFENSYLEYVTLHVPYGSVDKYKAVGPWKDFKEVVAVESAQRTFVLTYKVDGEVYKTYEVKEGEAITPEPEPTKEGYTFSGWSDIPSTMPANDVEVTGNFNVNKYNLIYKVNGEVYKEYEIEYGAEIIPEEKPTKEGWEFSGWSWIPKKMPAEDVVITGTFTQIEYDVDGSKYVIDDNEATIVDGGDAEGEVVVDATITINGKTYKVTVIGEDAYQGKDKITSVDIPDGIETIQANAFFNCGGINTVKIGKTIKYIGSKAFGNIWTSAVSTRASDNALTIECHAESVPETNADCFVGTSIANAVLLVEDAFVSSYKAVSPWCYFGKIMGFNEASGIDTIFTGQQDAVIYSLDGQRLDVPRKGMNIIKTSQGIKKIMIK